MKPSIFTYMLAKEHLKDPNFKSGNFWVPMSWFFKGQEMEQFFPLNYEGIFDDRSLEYFIEKYEKTP